MLKLLYGTLENNLSTLFILNYCKHFVYIDTVCIHTVLEFI